jgi:hypothetical protein
MRRGACARRSRFDRLSLADSAAALNVPALFQICLSVFTAAFAAVLSYQTGPIEINLTGLTVDHNADFLKRKVINGQTLSDLTYPVSLL